MSDDAVLTASGIDVSFGGLQALHEASIDARPGTITGLIGPNGAGKTTLFNVITGLQAPDEGQVILDGQDVTRAGVHKRARLGIGRTFQKLEPFNSLSARDNILVAAERAYSWRADITDPQALTDEIIDRVHLRDVAEITVGTLPTGIARLVELGRALAGRPKALLLDEASSGLTEDETLFVGDLLLQLTAEDDIAVLLVEHDMSFVMRVCAHIHVLDFGEIIARGTPDEIQDDELVRSAYLGTGV